MRLTTTSQITNFRLASALASIELLDKITPNNDPDVFVLSTLSKGEWTQMIKPIEVIEFSVVVSLKGGVVQHWFL